MAVNLRDPKPDKRQEPLVHKDLTTCKAELPRRRYDNCHFCILIILPFRMRHSLIALNVATSVLIIECKVIKIDEYLPLAKDGNVYFRVAEVTNHDWFIYTLYLKDSSSYMEALPDSAIWRKAYPARFPFGSNPGTGRMTAYGNYPVTGITYEQAMDYCKWHSVRASERNKETDRKIIYTLPSLDDYRNMLPRSQNTTNNGLYPSGRQLLTSMKAYRKVLPPAEYVNDKDFYRLKHKSGLFVGLCDNAHEMLAEEGKALAGLQNDSCLSVISYEAPSEALGFRCKCTVE